MYKSTTTDQSFPSTLLRTRVSAVPSVLLLNRIELIVASKVPSHHFTAIIIFVSFSIYLYLMISIIVNPGDPPLGEFGAVKHHHCNKIFL
jgi:hypothetical protein